MALTEYQGFLVTIREETNCSFFSILFVNSLLDALESQERLSQPRFKTEIWKRIDLDKIKNDDK